MGKGSSTLRPKNIKDLVNCIEVSRKEIKDWYIHFNKVYPSDILLTKEQFIDVYKSFFPYGDSEHFAHYVFRAFDTNNEEFINFRQFLCGIGVLLRGTVESKLGFAFSLYDEDDCGFITEVEFADILLALYKTMELDTCQPDKNTPKQKALQLYRKMDWEFGDVSKEEFFYAIMNDPEIVRLIEWNIGLSLPPMIASSCKLLCFIIVVYVIHTLI